MFENYDRGKGIPNASLCVCDICIWFKITFDVFGLHFFLWTRPKPAAGGIVGPDTDIFDVYDIHVVWSMTYLTSGGRFCSQGKKCLQATVTIVHWKFNYYEQEIFYFLNYRTKLAHLVHINIGDRKGLHPRYVDKALSWLAWSLLVVFIIIITIVIDDDIIFIIHNIFRLTTTRPCQWKVMSGTNWRR